jgi:hypothetical protein
MLLQESIRIVLNGTRPLLLCRGESASPFDPKGPDIRAISQKKKKTIEDHERLSRLQFESHAYYEDEIGIYLPTANLFKAIQQGAAKFKEASLVKGFVAVSGFVGKELDPAGAKLIYDGPDDIDALYNDKRFVSRVMGKIPGQRTSVSITRPIFPEWAAEFQIDFTEIAKDRVIEYLKIAGRFIGIGGWRPQHGTFTVEVVK